MAFTSGDNEFQTALTRIKKELSQQKDTPFADVEYDKIFDERVLNALETKDLKTAIENYVRRYNELLAASTYFKKGTFDYYNAGQIAKSLNPWSKRRQPDVLVRYPPSTPVLTTVDP